MAGPTAAEMDAVAARALREATSQLQFAFGEGGANVRDFPETLAALKELQGMLDKERKVEATLDQAEAVAEEADAAAPGPSGKAVAVMLDGSANSLNALKWTIETVLDPEDSIFLITVKASHIHTRTLAAKGSTSTGGVGEALVAYIESERMALVVLGSRGLGSIKASLMGSVGMGSVSDWCVHHLRCPIIVVRLTEDGEAELGPVAA
eukprot:scaffold2.g7016.t1